ncbi:hypothetical protein SETIT_9G045400v2 [Setaria italica]|uniref:Zinc finger GRF-type domain-containing protein n=1 Tax=Setaria italica TaxID=4555 RepID=A0A368SD29_SETIT|nr:hypothetical protein SETIT_9G045400v2 [Setaria italica]
MSSSSSLHSGSYSGCPELPLIPCKDCNQKVREFVSQKPESTRRRFYRCNNHNAQASYAVTLIREGFVTSSNQVIDTIMIAIDDHSRALESLTTSIRDMKKRLDNLEFMKQELDKLKADMADNEKNKKSMADELKLVKGDLQKLKGSATIKPRTLVMCSLGLLLLAILIGWFLMGLKNGEEAFRLGLMLSP